MSVGNVDDAHFKWQSNVNVHCSLLVTNSNKIGKTHMHGILFYIPVCAHNAHTWYGKPIVTLLTILLPTNNSCNLIYFGEIHSHSG